MSHPIFASFDARYGVYNVNSMKDFALCLLFLLKKLGKAMSQSSSI